ncbi:hypothetical protein DBR06_SOUSAS310007, partial [Sousa chinensis]
EEESRKDMFAFTSSLDTQGSSYKCEVVPPGQYSSCTTGWLLLPPLREPTQAEAA